TAPAGLYEGRADVRGVANRIGWIVLPDGTQTGVASGGGEKTPAPRLDPGSPDGTTLDGVPVQVRSISGADSVVG
ncbi:MAG TPA: hypothetical protein VD813_00385, partial [Pseudonocardia sp.]|nr:hypothetical protein [Pseudonocardia sp.]